MTTRPLSQLSVGDRFVIEGDHDQRVFTVIPGTTTTIRGDYLAARSHDGIPGYQPATLRVIKQ